MQMDWSTLLAGASFGVALIATMSGFVYLIMRLITQPMKESLTELKDTVKLIEQKIKTEGDLAHMISCAIVEHERSCPNKRGA